MEVVLFMFRANGATRSFPLKREVTVIGRREDCDLRIPLTEVSRKHCRVVVGAEEVRIEDLGSSNGTFHNGQRVQESVAKAGDYLQVGPVTFAFQIDGTPEEQQIVPPAQPEGAAELPPMRAAESSDTQAQPLPPPVPEQEAPVPEQETMQPSTMDLPAEKEDQEFIIADEPAEEQAPADDDIIDMGDNKR